MISTRAKSGFDQMVMQGIRSSLLGPNDHLQGLVPVRDLNEIRESEAVVLSVASFLFRITLMIYFSPDDPATRAHFARLHGMEAHDMSERVLLDTVAERGNMCCGAFNRELGRVYPYIGMSTPFFIERQCAAHLALLAHGHLQHFRLELGSGIHFHVTLCVREYEDLDFEPPRAEEAEATGELELF